MEETGNIMGVVETSFPFIFFFYYQEKDKNMANYKCKKCEITMRSKCMFQRSTFINMDRKMENYFFLQNVWIEDGKKLPGYQDHIKEAIISIPYNSEIDDPREMLLDVCMSIREVPIKTLKSWLCNHNWKVIESCMFGCCKIKRTKKKKSTIKKG